ncbi:MAG: hypothetical protein FGM43_04210 [Sinobacteraceae bacterium]|nr:hypothetical protein [Nevskiaceae bacterium]
MSGQPALLTSAQQIRDYLDVKEAAKLVVRTALGGTQGAVNVCSGIPITVREFAERIAAECGRPDLLRFGTRPDNAFDPPYVAGIPGPFHD